MAAAGQAQPEHGAAVANAPPVSRPWYLYSAAPMIHQSELAFRLTAVHYGATATWTQMYMADDLLQNQDVYETARRALELGRSAPENLDAVTRLRAPQVVQLAGCDPDALAQAARKISPWADGVDLNLDCPQRRAQEGHYGAYLLSRRDWPLVEQLTSALAQATELPVSTKLRLCDSAQDTPELAVRLAGAGSRLVTLHARHVAPNRRRAKAVKLEYVRDTVEALRAHGMHTSCAGGRTHVLSNGNVRAFSDVADNLQATGADGAMVGEPLLDVPDMFAPALGRPHADVRGVLATYLGYCEQYPVDVSLGYVHQHVQSIVRGKMPPGRDARALSDALCAAQSVAEMRGVLERP